MARPRAEAIYALVRGFADVITAEEPDEQKRLAVGWCTQCDAFYEEWPEETQSSLATYIGLALMDDEGMETLPGRVPAEMEQQVKADIFSVRALAASEDE